MLLLFHCDMPHLPPTFVFRTVGLPRHVDVDIKSRSDVSAVNDETIRVDEIFANEDLRSPMVSLPIS